MDLHLKDTCYIVTGGTRGLGYATAETLVVEGAQVVLAGRDGDRAAAAAQRLNELRAGSATSIACDLADHKAAERLTMAATEHGGTVSGALISVGGPQSGPTSSLSDDDFRSAFETVFLGARRVAHAVIDHAVDHNAPSSIVFVLSTSVYEPIAGLASSNALRPGIAMYAKTLADEYGHLGIRVNGLMPGRIATDRLAELDSAGGDPEGAKAAAIVKIPLGRYGRPEEFGAVAAFMLSPRAAYVSGTMLAVDGGMTRAL